MSGFNMRIRIMDSISAYFASGLGTTHENNDQGRHCTAGDDRSSSEQIKEFDRSAIRIEKIQSEFQIQSF